jgi:putative transposase
MPPISCAPSVPARGHPACLRLYLRFALSCWDVEDLPAERGLDVSYETVRRWVLKFGPAAARRLRQQRPEPNPR